MTAPAADTSDGASDTQRLDKWLWFARLAKSRTLAASLVAEGKVRVNRVKVVKPSHPVRVNDVITSAARKDVRIVRVAALGVRRGPPAEASRLYEEMTPGRLAGSDAASAETISRGAERQAGSGRPTKKERRQIDRLKQWDS